MNLIGGTCAAESLKHVDTVTIIESYAGLFFAQRRKIRAKKKKSENNSCSIHEFCAKFKIVPKIHCWFKKKKSESAKNNIRIHLVI